LLQARQEGFQEEVWTGELFQSTLNTMLLEVLLEIHHHHHRQVEVTRTQVQGRQE
jgi:hypothetical protein